MICVTSQHAYDMHAKCRLKCMILLKMEIISWIDCFVKISAIEKASLNFNHAIKWLFAISIFYTHQSSRVTYCESMIVMCMSLCQICVFAAYWFLITNYLLESKSFWYLTPSCWHNLVYLIYFISSCYIFYDFFLSFLFPYYAVYSSSPDTPSLTQ